MAESARPTVEELYHLLKNTSLPTVLVEGKNDIICYRAIEDELEQFGVDILPAGNKHSVLKLRSMLLESPVKCKVFFVVDKDLWVHITPEEDYDGVITTDGYSIENDLFVDGELESLLTAGERVIFLQELNAFIDWYAFAVSRSLQNKGGQFRAHPSKVLDAPMDPELFEGFGEDEYPVDLKEELLTSYRAKLRGKSLFALLLRRLCANGRKVKFSDKQLMAIGAARKGGNFRRIQLKLSQQLQDQMI
ncbi:MULTISPECIES: DUF4435 domain-containing protein [unclassified Xanthomonas]|uniref:DUF4435 domain-containing protein n=1 Tax=unclassified Xanthomonas TaxID=2643310 RepID=UPI002883273F|nr:MULTISPECIES: DUF4435 domain-containing protein [unclassified Xanthomonas]